MVTDYHWVYPQINQEEKPEYEITQKLILLPGFEVIWLGLEEPNKQDSPGNGGSGNIEFRKQRTQEAENPESR